jgi:hypothetical protein
MFNQRVVFESLAATIREKINAPNKMDEGRKLD